MRFVPVKDAIEKKGTCPVAWWPEAADGSASLADACQSCPRGRARMDAPLIKPGVMRLEARRSIN
jgi:hypothetical protein